MMEEEGKNNEVKQYIGKHTVTRKRGAKRLDGSQSLGVVAVVGETRNMWISIHILPAVYVYFLKHKQLTPSVT